MLNHNGIMLKLRFLLVIVTFQIISFNSAITTEKSENLNEFQYCLKKSSHPSLRECVGRSAISFLQRFDEKDNFTLAKDFVATKDDKVASRSLVNFLDTDPVDLRGILENAGAVFSQRSLEFHMDSLYPGLMFKIGPSADSNSVAQFMLDPTVDERNFNIEEASTARILTKQYVLPFLLGLKFNLVALVPILFTIICLLLKKSLFIAKLVVYISTVLGVGGVASTLGTFGGLGGLFGPSVFGGAVPPLPHSHLHGHLPGSVGLYPGKHSVFSQYDQDELNHNNVRTTVPTAVATPATDRFYEYEKQILMQDRSGKLRYTTGKLGPSAYSEDDEEVAGVINVSPSQRFKTSDNSGWKVVNLRV